MSYPNEKPEWLEEQEVEEELNYIHRFDNGQQYAPILKSPDQDAVRISLVAVCHDCQVQHNIDVIPSHFGDAAFGWHLKHEGHNFEFLTPKRIIPAHFDDSIFEQAGRAPWWLTYRENADLKLAYGTLTAMTITLASLATSATLVTGRQATSVDNSSNKYVDYRISAKITTGTTPTVSTEIRLYVIGTLDDSPTWPDTFGSTDAGVTVTNTQILDTLALSGSTLVSATSNIGYVFNRNLTVAECLGVVTKNWTVFVSHSTAVNLNATGGNHVVNYQGVYFTSI